MYMIIRPVVTAGASIAVCPGLGSWAFRALWCLLSSKCAALRKVMLKELSP